MAQRFDLHYQIATTEEQTENTRFATWGFTGTLGVKGFQFLINMWLKCFLTPRGSDPTDLNYGTDFPKLIGKLLPLGDARDVTLLAVQQCNTIISTFQRNDSTLTATELLASAQLINFVQDPATSRFDAYVEIKNRANERLRLSIPVSGGE